jgi:predicted nucleic-acid-binding Zn-ribbon protein
MADRTVCPKCPNTNFEAVKTDILNANHYYLIIRCTACGAAIGVTEFNNVGHMVHLLAKALNVDLSKLT